MNRRGLLGALLGFAVLPSATKYGRVWKFSESQQIFVPTNDLVYFEMHPCFCNGPGLYEFILERIARERDERERKTNQPSEAPNKGL